MTLMHTIYGDKGDKALDHEYERIFQEFQDCLRQRNRLESFRSLTRRQRRDLNDLRVILPALAGNLAEIHLKIVDSLSS